MRSEFSFSENNLNDPLTVVGLIREGLPGKDLSVLRKLYGDDEWVASAIGVRLVDLKNVCRRKRLKKHPSEKIIKLAELFDDCLELWQSEDRLRDWLFSEIPALGFCRPVDYLDTFEGIKVVRSINEKIKYGDYS